MRRRHQLSLSGQDSLPVGTTFDFNYTGTVQSIDLPKGRYKLQCWGAQGGNVTGTYKCSGSNGGYSEGVINLNSPQTIYVYVGGQGTSYTSKRTQSNDWTWLEGGWNGGGATRRREYDSSSSGWKLFLFPRPGGGATDMSTIFSDVYYPDDFNTTYRSDESLLGRFIVAGGGAGARGGSLEESPTSVTWVTVTVSNSDDIGYYGSYRLKYSKISDYIGCNIYFDTSYTYRIDVKDLNHNILISSNTELIIPDDVSYIDVYIYGNSGSLISVELMADVATITSWNSSQSEWGGGVSGGGDQKGNQSSAGYIGLFGEGGSVGGNYTSYSSAGGGGWYGGGVTMNYQHNDSRNLSGGGSGFVNIPSNAQYRPSGYTGLELESGQTIAGNTSFPSPSGGSETGHSGNGFARITVI